MAILFIFLVILTQNSLWPSFFGTYIPIYLWIPCLIYWAIYRNTGETIFMLYFITINIASTTSLPITYLLSFHALMVLVLFLFKRIYYTSWLFFNTACACALFCFQPVIWGLSYIVDNKSYFHGWIPWIVGGIITWVLAFPILSVFQWMDHITIHRSKEYQKSKRNII